mmetsp:Transcript_24092/g.44610  ORF Transcript_24092/g.44610 Transcript_24092/m.44610 type:complete len:262 (-) Transcript_24092:139-924(-)
MQGRIVQLGIVGQQDKRSACVQANLCQGVVGPVVDDPFARKARLGPERFARINDHGVIPRQPRHGQQRLRDVNAPDNGKAQGRIVNGDKVVVLLVDPAAVTGKAGGVACAVQLAGPTLKVHDIGHRFAGRAGRNQIGEHLGGHGRPHRFHQNADCAAAGQAHSKGIIVADPVFQQTWFAVLQRLHGLHDHSPFDTAARDRAHHLARSRHNKLRPGPARGAAPGLHDGGQCRAHARLMPGKGLFRCCFRAHRLSLRPFDPMW